MRLQVPEKIRKFTTSAALGAAMGFALGGAGFAVANLLLAKYLSPADFGLVSLLIALNEFGLSLGSSSFELVVNRHRLGATPSLFIRVLLACLLFGTLITVAAHELYGIDPTIGCLLIAMLVGRALTKTAASVYQADQHFTAALTLGQMHNVVLLATVAIALLLRQMNVLFVVWAISVGYLLVAAVGWERVRRSGIGAGRSISNSVLLREGASAAGIGMATMILWQAERFAIPVFLSMEAMATYGVLAAVVSAPFRMMQLGVGYTMLPRLRAAASFSEVRSLLARELKVSAAVCCAGTALVVVLMPVVLTVFLDGKYRIGAGLLTAAIIVGYVKIWEGFAVSALYAAATPRALSLMTLSGWTSLFVAAGGAWLLREWGLAGIIYGVGLGWLWQAIAATVLAVRCLRTRWGLSAAPGQ